MSRFLYTLVLLVLLPAVWLRLYWRGRRQPAYRQHWVERFGFYPDRWPEPVAENERPIWLHAVSVGETRAAAALIAELRARAPQRPILLTHMTPTGRQTTVSLAPENLTRVYLPYDYPFAVRRFLKRFRPAVGLLMETELWPNLVATCHAAGIPLLLVNARLSERSARRYARFPQLSRQTLRGLRMIAAQSEADAQRLRALGASSVEVLGNLKFDIEPPQVLLTLGARFRLRIGERPVLLAASTREGEEALLLDALARQPLDDNGLLILVPRHPQRFDAVAGLIGQAGLIYQRRSQADEVIAERTRVWLGDSMGELFAYYAACDVAFIGGSLLDHGGQNLIEACAVGCPVLIGPSTDNFAEAVAQALACDAARQVGNAAELLDAAGKLLADAPRRQYMSAQGRAFSARHRGASRRTAELTVRAMR